MKNPVPRKIPPSGKQALDVTSSSCLGEGSITSLSCFWRGGGRVELVCSNELCCHIVYAVLCLQLILLRLFGQPEVREPKQINLFR